MDKVHDTTTTTATEGDTIQRQRNAIVERTDAEDDTRGQPIG